MKILKIRWQRLLNDNEETCPRCGETGTSVQTACAKLKKALAQLDIEVELVQEAIDFSRFSKDPLQSNCIWIGGRLLEEWLGATTGQSKCCDACGDADCRTISIGSATFEAIPEQVILRAGLLAAADLLGR